MKVISGILMLVAISGASASASAAKFDFNNALNSVLKSVLDTSQFDDVSETKPSVIEPYYSDTIIRTPTITGCVSYSDCKDYPEQRRMIHKDLENEPYACSLDDFSGSIRQGGYAIVDGYAVYASDQWVNAENECFERIEINAENKAREKQKEAEREAERIAKIPKKPEVKIGMTKDQVTKSRWGSPIFRDITTNSKGTYEKWRYSNRTLYFTNGKLTSIEEIKTFLD